MRLWKPIVGLLLLALALSGCYVQSLNPFYLETDLVNDDEILGEWVTGEKENEDEHWIFEKTGERGYSLSITENDVSTSMVVRVFELQGEKFMDFSPETNSLKGYAGTVWIPVHLMAKYTMDAGGLVICPLGLDWFKNMALKRKIDIDYTVYGDNVPLLTDETPNMQNFLIQYMNEAFANSGRVELGRPGAIGKNDAETDTDSEQPSREDEADREDTEG